MRISDWSSDVCSSDLTKSPGQKLESYVRIRVRDDGMGMPEDVRRKILDPFFTTKAGAGTGLGVPQVDAFVRRAGGFMRIATAIGVGSTFDLFFPYDGILGDARKTISHEFGRESVRERVGKNG